jgi:hypothetical protein
MALLALVAALALAMSAPAKPGLADCLGRGLPDAQRTAVLDLRLIADTGERLGAAEAIVRQPETRAVMDRCGAPANVGAELGLTFTFLRWSAEAELEPRYAPEALDTAFEAARPEIEVMLLEQRADESSERLAKPFLKALGSPSTADHAALIRYAEARVFGLLPALALKQAEAEAARERAEEARRAGAAPPIAPD